MPADRAAFQAQSLVFGPALLEEWRDAHHEVGGFIAGVQQHGAGYPNSTAAAIGQDQDTRYHRSRLRNYRENAMSRVTNDVKNVTGRDAISFDSYARDNAAAFR